MKNVVAMAQMMEFLPAAMKDAAHKAAKEAGENIDKLEMHRHSHSEKAKVNGLDPKTRKALKYVSYRTQDRDDEIVVPGGIDLKEFRKNPVCLVNHNYSLLPVGSDDLIECDEYGIKALTTYADTGEGTLANVIWALVSQGHLRTSSIGFVPITTTKPGKKDWDVVANQLQREWKEFDKGRAEKSVSRIITKGMLLEHSDVTVPCNTDAETIQVLKMMKVTDEKVMKGLGWKSEKLEDGILIPKREVIVLKSAGVVPVIKGGQGSGNFGHSGRPGEVGGSSDDGGEAGGLLIGENSDLSSLSGKTITGFAKDDLGKIQIYQGKVETNASGTVYITGPKPGAFVANQFDSVRYLEGIHDPAKLISEYKPRVTSAEDRINNLKTKVSDPEFSTAAVASSVPWEPIEMGMISNDSTDAIEAYLGTGGLGESGSTHLVSVSRNTWDKRGLYQGSVERLNPRHGGSSGGRVVQQQFQTPAEAVAWVESKVSNIPAGNWPNRDTVGEARYRKKQNSKSYQPEDVVTKGVPETCQRKINSIKRRCSEDMKEECDGLEEEMKKIPADDQAAWRAFNSKLNGMLARIAGKKDDEESETAEDDEVAEKGGSGSGNFGHAGRVGEVGGSSDEGGRMVTSGGHTTDRMIFNQPSFSEVAPTGTEWDPHILVTAALPGDYYAKIDGNGVTHPEKIEAVTPTRTPNGQRIVRFHIEGGKVLDFMRNGEFQGFKKTLEQRKQDYIDATQGKSIRVLKAAPVIKVLKAPPVDEDLVAKLTADAVQKAIARRMGKLS